jgi:hypothetical protein
VRLPFPPRRLLRFALAAAVFLVPVALGVAVGCGPDQSLVWICLNPVTGKLPGAPYDSTHYVNGVFDPCHCYDPCGPEKSCPMLVDAGPAPPGCDGGDSGEGGSDGGW